MAFMTKEDYRPFRELSLDELQDVAGGRSACTCGCGGYVTTDTNGSDNCHPCKSPK